MVTTAQLSSKIIASEQTAIQTLLEKLLEIHPDEILQVILFGSKARGDFTGDSDIDILVLVGHETWGLRYAIWAVAAQVELDYDNVIFNIQVIGNERWKQMNREQFSLCQSIKTDGVILFTR